MHQLKYTQSQPFFFSQKSSCDCSTEETHLWVGLLQQCVHIILDVEYDDLSFQDFNFCDESEGE